MSGVYEAKDGKGLPGTTLPVSMGLRTNGDS